MRMAIMAKGYPIVIGMDPGIRNFGYAVARMDHDGSRYEMLQAGILSNPIQNLDDIDTEADNFRREVKALFGGYRSRLLVIERFQTRYIVTHSMGEIVNMMIGIVAHGKYAHEYQLISAGAWKKQASTTINLKELYRIARQYTPAHRTKVPHAIDAACMGILYGARYLGNPDPTSILTPKLANHVADILNT